MQRVLKYLILMLVSVCTMQTAVMYISHYPAEPAAKNVYEFICIMVGIYPFFLGSLILGCCFVTAAAWFIAIMLQVAIAILKLLFTPLIKPNDNNYQSGES